MQTAFPPWPAHTDWKALYRAAILQTNKNAISRLVSQAEKAVISRNRELVDKLGTLEEKEQLEDALYALRAFQTAL